MAGIIDTLRDRAERAPAAAAAEDANGPVSCAELVRRVDETVATFEHCGCVVAGLMADNSVDWLVADLAALASGTTLVPIPPYFTASQQRHLLAAGAVDTVIVDERFGAAFGPDAFEALDERLGSLRLLKRRTQPDARIETSLPAKITFTSGSTGQPKGVCLSPDLVNAVADRLCALFGDLGIERHLCVMPLATLLENVAGVYVPLMLGACVHVPSLATLGLYGSSRIDGRRFRRAVETSRAESLIVQPELLRVLTAAAREEGPLDRLKFVAVGGARVADADLDDAADTGIPAFQGYGLSECGSVVALNRAGAARAGSVGRPLPGVDVRISPDGEILVAGQCMQGYLGDTGEEPACVATGDVGHFDDDGFLYVTGRRKNVFITSFGRNVSPEWPESELVHQPQFAQACVFGEARASNVAIVVPSRAGIDADEIAGAIDAANGALPDYARIVDWIVAAEPFSPSNGMLTPTGKPRRDAIAAAYGIDRPAESGLHASPNAVHPSRFEPKRSSHDVF